MTSKNLAAIETNCHLGRLRLPTPRQWRFAEAYATGALSLADCYRTAYSTGRGQHSEGTVYTEASKLARNPRVQWAVARIQAEAQGATRLEQLQTRAHARFADHAIRESARRAGYVSKREAARLAERAAQRQRRDAAWRLFAQAYMALEKAKCGAPSFLPPAERTRIVFEHYGPVAPPPVAAVCSLPPAERDTAEIEVLVRRQQQVRATVRGPLPVREDAPAEESTSDRLRAIETLRHPGEAAPPEPAGEWVLVPVRGAFPPRQKRIWVPAGRGDL